MILFLNRWFNGLFRKSRVDTTLFLLSWLSSHFRLENEFNSPWNYCWRLIGDRLTSLSNRNYWIYLVKCPFWVPPNSRYIRSRFRLLVFPLLCLLYFRFGPPLLKKSRAKKFGPVSLFGHTNRVYVPVPLIIILSHSIISLSYKNNSIAHSVGTFGHLDSWNPVPNSITVVWNTRFVASDPHGKRKSKADLRIPIPTSDSLDFHLSGHQIRRSYHWMSFAEKRLKKVVCSSYSFDRKEYFIILLKYILRATNL